jgi:glycosyltransferase involved in cell wall biosynthesis
MPDAPMVSCLCVTRRRVPMLRRSVACFRKQTYQPRELIAVFLDDDAETREYFRELNDPMVRCVEVPAEPRPSLGALRNLAVAESRGAYVATWDDDDWHASARLAEQMAAVQETGRHGCLLVRWLIFDQLYGVGYISNRHPLEGSLLVEKSVLPPFPELPKLEDTPVVKKLYGDEKLCGIDRPRLYVYVHHGANTWDRQHFEKRVLYNSSLLPAEDTEKLRRVLQQPY